MMTSHPATAIAADCRINREPLHSPFAVVAYAAGFCVAALGAISAGGWLLGLPTLQDFGYGGHAA